MEIKQFEDKKLSLYSYAILSEGKIALVDPERDPAPYYDFAKKNNATIVAVFETHPHADFISSHAEINRATGAPIYVSKLLGAQYPFHPFDDGDSVKIGNVTFKSLNTPGHSPDSICIVANEDGKDVAVFTGDTLFIGDCGRPDLRESAGALTGKREELARKMYHSLRDKLAVLSDDTKVYPTHGAGSLCGRGLSSAHESTIGKERATNWSLQKYTEDEFVKELLTNQPFAPKYFTNSVNMNRKGGPDFQKSIANIKVSHELPISFDANALIIDIRSGDQYRKGAVEGSINIREAGKLETWLGAIVAPGELFYIIAGSEEQANSSIRRIAKIGYEGQIKGAFVVEEIPQAVTSQELDVPFFKANEDKYTIIDVRNHTEVNKGKIFPGAISIPLPELRERVSEVPTNKPIVVHCAAGYRSAIAEGILRNFIHDKSPVLDLGGAITSFVN